jgi:hypothetical protein
MIGVNNRIVKPTRKGETTNGVAREIRFRSNAAYEKPEKKD